MAFIAPTNTSISGTAMAFGFAEGYSPSITGFLPRSISSSDGEPEIFVTATNGEGEIEAIAISKNTRGKMLKVQITGYITTSFDKNTLANSFVGGSGPMGGRRFFIKKISDPVAKGAMVEVTIDAESYPAITTA